MGLSSDEDNDNDATPVLHSPSQRRAFVVQMIGIYREAALTQLVEAEDAIVKAIELREHALGLLDRAAELAYEFAREEDARKAIEASEPVKTESDEDDIAW